MTLHITQIPDWQATPACLPDLTATAVHVWRANLHCNATQLLQLQRLLSPDEITRAQRFKFPRHQHRFIAARGMLRQLLARYLQQSAADIVFQYTPQGKPHLQANAAIYFNVSHSNDWALYAIGTHPLLGIDIEYIM